MMIRNSIFPRRKVPLRLFCGMLGACAIGPAIAANGNIWIGTCACSKTSDFGAAASTLSFDSKTNGTALLVSTTTSMSAYVEVTGSLVNYYGTLIWTPTTYVPVNVSGQSLAGQSEASLEAAYGAIDVSFFGTRVNPRVVEEPSSYSGSIINSDDAEVGPGIDSALIGEGINWSSLPIGFVITVKFEDGTSAQFILTNHSSTLHWMWNGVAHNAKGQAINRAGVVTTTNPNTGGQGFGTISGTGFNFANTKFTDMQFQFGPQNFCTVSIEIGDIGDGVETISTGLLPC